MKYGIIQVGFQEEWGDLVSKYYVKYKMMFELQPLETMFLYF